MAQDAPQAVTSNSSKPSKSLDGLDYHALNAMLNLYDDEGKIQLDRDRQAARQYFLQHVNQNTVFSITCGKRSIIW